MHITDIVCGTCMTTFRNKFKPLPYMKKVWKMLPAGAITNEKPQTLERDTPVKYPKKRTNK